MNTREQETSHRGDSPPGGNDCSCLELMLRLQPFPCLVVETETARPVLTNEEARRMLFEVPPGVAGLDACYATDADGGRIEPEQVIPYVVGRDAGGDGVELTWHALGRRQFFRVASRALPRKDGTNPLSMLSFLDLTGQKMAEGELRDAVEARDEFFSVATHELKDPLFSLQLSIQLLRHSAERQGPVPPHVIQHLDVSERQVMRLGRLIDNMLDVARIVNGRIDLDMETLDLCELAHQVVGRFLGQATLERDVAFGRALPPGRRPLRPAQARAGDRQPALQCDQVRRRQADRRPRPRRGAVGGGRGPGPRRRDRPGGPGADLRAIPGAPPTGTSGRAWAWACTSSARWSMCTAVRSACGATPDWGRVSRC